MDELELLYDHYKETNTLRIEAQKRRNMSFLLYCVLEALLFFFLIQPETMKSVFQSFILGKVGITTQLGNNTLQTFLWICVAYMVIRYIQETLYIERQYKYQDLLETQIRRLTNGSLFSREGSLYIDDYPNSLNLIDLFYKVFCPILFVIINIGRIFMEWKTQRPTFSLICDTIVFVALLIIIWAYFFDIHNGVSKFCRNWVPGFKSIAEWIREVLKKV